MLEHPSIQKYLILIKLSNNLLVRTISREPNWTLNDCTSSPNFVAWINKLFISAAK